MKDTNFPNSQNCVSTHSESEMYVRMNLKEIHDSLHHTLEHLIAIFPESFLVRDTKETISSIDSNRFYIFVMGGMASGKTTLINALIGHNIPYTLGQSTICSYVSEDTDYFTIRGYDLLGEEILCLQMSSIEELDLFTPDKTVAKVEIWGRLPLAEETHLNIAIAEIPYIRCSQYLPFFKNKQGFAIYCQDVCHMGLFHEMMDVASHILKPFDAKLCKGSYFYDEQIPALFCLTKMDTLKPQYGDNVNNCIEAFRDELADANIRCADVLPISVLSLNKDDDFSSRDCFERKCSKFPQLQLEQYSRLSEWPHYSKSGNVTPYEKKYDETDLHTGFPNLHKFIYTYLTEEILCHKIKSIATLLENVIGNLINSNQSNMEASSFEILQNMSQKLKIICEN